MGVCVSSQQSDVIDLTTASQQHTNRDAQTSSIPFSATNEHPSTLLTSTAASIFENSNLSLMMNQENQDQETGLQQQEEEPIIVISLHANNTTNKENKNNGSFSSDSTNHTKAPSLLNRTLRPSSCAEAQNVHRRSNPQNNSSFNNNKKKWRQP